MKIKKFLTPTRLASRLALDKRAGKKVVFTNGVYDLLHAGHVTLLEKAKRLGDILVVGINSDASTRRLKGHRRPIALEKDRAKVLAALGSVNYVTSFSQNTPYELIKRLKPDVLVKGGDYATNRIVGRDLVKKVVRVPLVKGRSTSALVSKILRSHGR